MDDKQVEEVTFNTVHRQDRWRRKAILRARADWIKRQRAQDKREIDKRISRKSRFRYNHILSYKHCFTPYPNCWLRHYVVSLRNGDISENFQIYLKEEE